MRKSLVMTLSGKDRIGIVEQVTRQILDSGGNVESSRMARLGGEFTMLMLVSIDESRLDELDSCTKALEADGYSVITKQTEEAKPELAKGWLPYKIEVSGADHEGIIHKITKHLSAQSINIETLDTGTIKAPMSGTPLFVMSATVLVPPKMTFRSLQDELNNVGDTLNVDIDVSPYKG